MKIWVAERESETGMCVCVGGGGGGGGWGVKFELCQTLAFGVFMDRVPVKRL